MRKILEPSDGKARNRVMSAELIAALCADETAPWGDWRSSGKPITGRALAALLRAYGIKPKAFNVGGGKTLRGYEHEQFIESWSRYLADRDDPECRGEPEEPEVAKPPIPPIQGATPATLAQPSRSRPDHEVQPEAEVADSQEPANPHGDAEVADVAVREGGAGKNTDEHDLFGDLEREEPEKKPYDLFWSCSECYASLDAHGRCPTDVCEQFGQRISSHQPPPGPVHDGNGNGDSDPDRLESAETNGRDHPLPGSPPRPPSFLLKQGSESLRLRVILAKRKTVA